MEVGSKKLIDIAFDDLKSARILYEHRQYRSSYYDFQQAVEKANKALGVLSGNVSANDLKDKVGHKQMKIYRDATVRREKEVSEMLHTIKPYPELKSHSFFSNMNFDEYRVMLNKAISSIDRMKDTDLVNISSDTLDDMLSRLRETENYKLPSAESMNIKEHLRKGFLEMADIVSRIKTPNAINMKQEYEQFVGDDSNLQLAAEELNKFLISIMGISFVFYTFYFCAIITVQHSNRPRYPDKNGNNPLEIYTADLPIVKMQPEFMDMFEKALLKLVEISNHLAS